MHEANNEVILGRLTRESLLLVVRDYLRVPLPIQPGFSGRASLARE
jgi:hypothetical protein